MEAKNGQIIVGTEVFGLKSEAPNLTSFLGQPAPEPKAKGMKPEQKKRLARCMDNFRETNGGCLLCKGEAKSVEFSAYPDITAERARLFLYGLCKNHAKQQGSDSKAEQIMMKEADTAAETTHEKALMVMIDYGDEEKETVKFM